jgi:urease accessory protein
MYSAAHEFNRGEPQRLPRSVCLAHGSYRDTELERAAGAGRVVFAGGEDGTKIVDIYQKFPVALAFPEIDDARHREAVTINRSGGVAGGDRLQIEIVAQSGSSVAMTTQAAEKVYRALDRPAQVTTRLEVHENAKLAWLPQETIVFDKARIKRRTEVILSSGAEMAALEWLVLGRVESGEKVRSGYVLDSWRVSLDGRLVWAEGFLLSDEMLAHIHKLALLSKWKAIGTLIYFGPDVARRLEVLREIAISLDCKCAATLVGAIIVVRVAAVASVDLKRGIRRLLDQFSRELGPGPFRTPKMWSC